MKINGIVRVLFVTTSLSAVATGMDAGNHGRIPEMGLMDPNRSFVRNAGSNMTYDIKVGVAKDFEEFADLLKKAWNGDWEKLAGISIHQIIDYHNNQFLSRYSLPLDNNEEFNPESFKPFLKAFREQVILKLHNLLVKNGSAYALNESTGERYPLYNGTPFQQLARYLIPDCMPMKSIFISICNLGWMNDYLGSKLDELALTHVFRLHQWKTGKTVKNAAASYMIGTPAKGIKGAKDIAQFFYKKLVTEKYPDCEFIPTLTSDEIEDHSPFLAYLHPHLNHLAREALRSLFLEVGGFTKEFIINNSVKLALQNPMVVNTTKGASCMLALGGTMYGWNVGGLTGGLIGGIAAGSFAGPGIIGAGMGAGIGYVGYEITNRLRGTKEEAPVKRRAIQATGAIAGGLALGASGPLGMAIAGSLGTTIGSWAGAAAGGFGGLFGGFSIPPRIVTHATASLARTTKQELDDRLKLLVDYYTYYLLPVTPDQHALRSLNPDPTEAEKILYHEDYARQERLLCQSLSAAAIKHLIDLGGQYIPLPLGEISEKYHSFIKYCFASNDATAQKILEEVGLTDKSSSEAQDKERDSLWRAFVLRTADPRNLTPEDQTLQENLGRFPSFKMKREYLDQLSPYMNSLSAGDLKKFAEDFRGKKEAKTTERERIIELHKITQTVGTRMAEIYRTAGRGEMDVNTIEDIQASANHLWETATTIRLERLAEMLGAGYLIANNNGGHPDEEVKESAIDKNYLERTLNAYIQERDGRYLAQDNNQSLFNAFKESSLTEDLKDADVVDLLRNIKGLDSQSLPEKIQSVLARAGNGEQAAAQEKDPVSVVKERKLSLIKNKYESLLGTQLRIQFTKIFHTQFQDMIQEIGQKSLKNNLSLTDQLLYKNIKTQLSGTRSFEKLMKQIEEHPRAGLFSEATFSQIKGQILETAKILILKNKNPEESFDFVDRAEAWEAHPVEAEPDIQELKVYNPYDISGYTLTKIINTLFKEKIDSLAGGDFEKIYEAIQENEKMSIKGSDTLFLEQYEREIMEYIISEKSGLAEKLFYGYTEVINSIRSQNNQILDLIKNLKK